MSEFIKNKKVGLNYEILETFEAGIELLGHEVKTIRGKRGSLEGSHITIRGGEAFLIGSHLPPYQSKNVESSYDSHRNRRLLLSKKEIALLGGAESKKGLTVVPVSMYSKGRKIKVSVAIARGKKKYDRRATLKKRESKREIERTLKYR